MAGIVQHVAGESIDAYLKCRLFDPLGIRSVTWLCDCAGNNYGMSHLTINALDLGKVGMLIANQGCWNGTRILCKEWIDFMRFPSQAFTPFYGPLNWLGYDSLTIHWDQNLINYYAEAGVSEDYLTCLRATQGYVFNLDGYISFGTFTKRIRNQLDCYFGSIENASSFLSELGRLGVPFGNIDLGYPRSLAARGYLGQQLIVMPDDNLIAVRLSNRCGTSNGEVDSFLDLELLLQELAYEYSGLNFKQDFCDCPQ